MRAMKLCQPEIIMSVNLLGLGTTKNSGKPGQSGNHGKLSKIFNRVEVVGVLEEERGL